MIIPVKIRFRTIINFLAALIVFSDAYSAKGIIPFFELRGSYFILPLVLLLCLLIIRRLAFNRNFLIVFSIITFVSVLSILFGTTTTLLVSKVVISVFLNALTFYMVFKVNDYDVREVFIIYLNFAFIISSIGILQELNNIFKLLPGFGVTLPLKEIPLYRITSIFPEPAHYCEAMIPALFTAVATVIQRNTLLERWKSWIIIVSFVFTFSTVGYFGIIISILLLIINYNKIKYLIVGGVVLPFLILIAYFNVREIRLRVDGTYYVVTGRIPLISTNWSTFSLISNWEIGFLSFIENPLFGGGIGSHPVSYRKNIHRVLGKDIKKLEEGISITPLNVEDAASLFNRLLSETGLFGLFAFLVFIARSHVLKKDDRIGYLWIINNAALVFFIIKLLRGGHYFIYGVFLFFWIYYFTRFQSDILKFKLRKYGEI
jgi:hypothetical protein